MNTICFRALSLSRTSITYEGFNLFSERVALVLETINNFKLDISNTDLSNESARVMFQTRNSKLKKVEPLVVNLDHTRITDESIESVIDFVVNVKGSLLNLKATWLEANISESKREIFRVIHDAILKQ